MGTAAYYRREAQRCRELAAQSSFTVKAELLRLADEYDQLAKPIDVPAPRSGMVQHFQPIQQQQQKATDTEK
jgi:hypothetical protein